MAKTPKRPKFLVREDNLKRQIHVVDGIPTIPIRLEIGNGNLRSYTYTDDGVDIDELILELTAAKSSMENPRVHTVLHPGCCGDDDEYSVQVVGFRYLTEQEQVIWNAICEKQAVLDEINRTDAATRREQAERAEYDRLKKQYGNN